MFQVFENDKPAEIIGSEIWGNSKFNTMIEAINYAKKWLGDGYCPKNFRIKLNEKYYFAQNCYIEIKKV